MNISRRTVLIGTTALGGLMAMGLDSSLAFAADDAKTLHLPLARPAGIWTRSVMSAFSPFRT